MAQKKVKLMVSPEIYERLEQISEDSLFEPEEIINQLLRSYQISDFRLGKLPPKLMAEYRAAARAEGLTVRGYVTKMLEEKAAERRAKYGRKKPKIIP